MKSGIYSIRQVSTGRRYIGSAVDLTRRLAEHRRRLDRGDHHNRKLQLTWHAQGASDFVFEIVELVLPCALIHREQHHIDKTRSAESGFNLRPNARNNLGAKFEPRTAESKARSAKAARGRRLSAETKAKIAAANRGKPGPFLGRHLSLEHRQKIVSSLRGRKLSPAHRLKTLNILKARGPISELSRSRLRAAQRQYWDSPAGVAARALRAQRNRELWNAGRFGPRRASRLTGAAVWG